MSKDGYAIEQISAAKRALAEVSTLHDALDLRDKMAAVKVYADAIGAGEIAQQAKETQLRAERLAGKFLQDMPKAKGKRTDLQPTNTVLVGSNPTLEELGVSHQQSSRWQKIASIPDERFEAAIQRAHEESQELTQAALLRVAQGAHVANNSGENEWYTPPEYTEAARRVMGAIDYDPASSDVANKFVRAGSYDTAETDGLRGPWAGRVWMNPPYAQPLIAQFCGMLKNEYMSGRVPEAIVLVNNATETGWFQDLLSVASAVCFVRGRIKYLDATGTPANTPLQGQAILYFGDSADAFDDVFCEFGLVLRA